MDLKAIANASADSNTTEISSVVNDIGVMTMKTGLPPNQIGIG